MHALRRGLRHASTVALDAPIPNAFIAQTLPQGTISRARLELPKLGLPGRRPEQLERRSWKDILAIVYVLGDAAEYRDFITAINACARAKRPDQALGIIELMRETGLQPNFDTYVSLLSACSMGKRAYTCIEILAEMRHLGYKPNYRCYNHVIGAFGRKGDWKAALEFLGDLHQAYNAAIGRCMKKLDCRRADNFLTEMSEAGVVPDAASYNGVIHVHGRSGSFQRVMELLESMNQAGLVADFDTYMAALQACWWARDWHMAVRLLTEMRLVSAHPTVASYNLVIAACGRAKQTDSLQPLLDEMPGRGVTPDEATYAAVITAYAQSRQFSNARAVFDRLLAEHPTLAGVHVFNAAIDAFSATQWVSAVEIFELGIERGVYGEFYTSQALDVGQMTVPTACVALHWWLRGAVAASNQEPSPEMLMVVTGSSAVRAAVSALVQSFNIPLLPWCARRRLAIPGAHVPAVLPATVSLSEVLPGE